MLLRALRPTEKELEAMARAETDPTRYAQFEPICRGPIFAILVLALAGFITLATLPIRMVRLWFRRSALEIRVHLF
jgi:hypothetical protein